MDFTRARSKEEKEIRINEIKRVADELFKTHPYGEITLTVIAEKLTISRANLYKYAKSKEEIFLLLAEDKRDDYFASLLAAFPEGCHFSDEVIADVWAAILSSKRDYLSYSEILTSIIETNVSIDRLATFKKNYYKAAEVIANRLSLLLGLNKEVTYSLFMSVYYQAMGLSSGCFKSEKIWQAIKKANLDVKVPDLRAELKNFILTMLKGLRFEYK